MNDEPISNPKPDATAPKIVAGPEALRTETPSGLPEARIERNRAAWLFWLVPLAAALVCGGFYYRDVLRGGPTITIYFQNADGLEENNTQLRYRGASVGQVKSLALTPDNRHVQVRVRLTGPAEHLARAGSVFWIVRPELRVGSISGLRTIISGEYITVQPGAGPPTNTFFGVEKEPLAGQPGALRIILLASDLSTLQEESPILYRGVEVGEILNCQLGTNAQEVVIQASIREEYAPLVRRNSVFWNAGRFNVSWGLFRGAQIGADSPAALLTGAIEFATPTDLQDPATNGMVFRLNDKMKDDWKNWSPVIRLSLPGAPTGKSAGSGTK